MSKVTRPSRAGRRVVAALASVALVTTMAACSSSASPGASASSTLTMALPELTNLTFDPWTAPAGYNDSVWYNGALYDSLTHVNAQGQPVPWLATSWKYDGPSKLTLTLRTGVKFSDGTPLDAAAVAANVKYAQADKQAGQCDAYLAGIRATAIDATTVQLSLTQSNPDLLTDLGTCAGFIVSPASLANPATLKSAPIGSGPYLLSASGTVQGQSITFTRNANYWNKSAFPFSKIVLKAFTNTTAAANAARTNQVDLIEQVDPKTDTSGLAHSLSSPQTFRGIFFSDVSGTLSKPLQDVRVRQAMNYAVDRAAIVKSLYATGSAALNGSTPLVTGETGYSSSLDNYYSYDPAKATQLLTAAGYPHGFTLKVVEYPAFAGNLIQAMAGSLRKVGINLDISDHPNDFITQVQAGTWPATLVNYTLSTSVFHNLTGLVSKDAFFNGRHQTNPQFDSLLTQIGQTTDQAALSQLYSQLAAAIQQQAWFLVPAVLSTALAYNTKHVKIVETVGSAVPFLYNISPA